MKHILAAILILSVLWAEAQTIQMTPASLNFGTVLETDRDSFQISLSNLAPRDVGIRGAHLPSFYGSSPYFLHALPAQIPAQGNSSFWIGLEVEHNIDHSSGFIIDTDSFYGSFVCPIQAVGRYSNSYYNSTNDLEGTALFQALRNRISSPYTDLGYTSARDQMYASIDHSNGQVECAYTGRTASFSTRSGANSNNFNCEHTFPQSFYNSNVPMRSDIHHLFPTDVTSNSQRGNLPFGIVTSSPSWQQGGSKKGNGVFEPRDAQKGRTARAMLYFALRYQDYSNFLSGQESVLRNWHAAFPPNAAERNRNQAIASVQQNRNPFVDHPVLIDRLGPYAQNGSLTSESWTIHPDTLYMRYGTTANVVLSGRSNRTATVQLTGSALQWSAQGSAPYPEGIHQGSLDMLQNASGQEELQLLVNGQVVDRVHVFLLPASNIALDETAQMDFEIHHHSEQEAISLRLPSKEIYRYEILGMSGARCQSGEVRSGELISIQALGSATYLLKVTDQEGRSGVRKCSFR